MRDPSECCGLNLDANGECEHQGVDPECCWDRGFPHGECALCPGCGERDRKAAHAVCDVCETLLGALKECGGIGPEEIERRRVDFRAKVMSQLETLTPRERSVLRERFGVDL